MAFNHTFKPKISERIAQFLNTHPEQ